MNLLVMADREVGDSISRWLLNAFPDDPSIIVTTSKNDIYRSVQDNNIRVVVYESPRQIVDLCKSEGIEIDIGILAWWPTLVKRPLLELPKYGFINTHPSLLPYNRGKHYNFWALVEQVPFGVSLHLVDEGVDSGGIVAQRQIPYTWEDTGGTLYRKAREEIIQLFTESYPSIRQLEFNVQEQDLSMGSTHLAKELDDASRIEIDQEYKARDLLNLIRARTFEGYPACWFADGSDEYEVRVEIRRKPQ